MATLGAKVAPAPLALLSRDNPVRAVFGHVEPTFDWTLKDVTKQSFGGQIVKSLSSNFHHGQPWGSSSRPPRRSRLPTNRGANLADRLNNDHDMPCSPLNYSHGGGSTSDALRS